MSLLLQQGLQAHQQGDYASARKYYEKQLAAHPNDVNGLQLLGSLNAAEHNYAAAIELTQKALELRHDQPQLWLNLAICYKKLQRLEAAQQACLKTLELAANHQQAYEFMIGLLLDSGQNQEALDWCERAIKQFNQAHRLVARKAAVLAAMQDYQQAKKCYQSLLQLQPDNPTYLHDFAVLLRQTGESEQALKIFKQLQQSGQSSYALWHNMGNAYSDLGQLQAAIDCYQQALKLNPLYCETHVNLSEMLWEAGQTDSFVDSFQLALGQYPNDLPLRLAYCRLLLRTRNYQLCAEVLQQVCQTHGDNPEWLALLARAHKGLGNTEQSLRYFESAVSQAHADKETKLQYAQGLLEAQQVSQATSLLQQLVADYPQDQFAWALLGSCWRISKNPQEQQLNNYQHLVAEYTIATPPGYDSLEDFCQQLNDYLSSLHTGQRQPLEQTLSGGTQTRGNLFNQQHRLIQQLITQLEICIDDYIQRSQPFAFVPDDYQTGFEFAGSWSVRLKDQGFHTPHVHPMGWISSAFYVDLPDEVNGDEQQGWFCLGKPNLDTRGELDAQQVIQPQVGKLVLFRSYMWHSTLPFNSKKPRTTVAFDVIPKKLTNIN